MVEVAARFSPDILCVQEAHPLSLSALLARGLREHTCVEPPSNGDRPSGWEYEGNVLWNRSILEEEAHGEVDVGIREKLRRLFWVRLRLRGSSTGTGGAAPKRLLVGTAHLTWQGSAEEVSSEVCATTRATSARRCGEALMELAASVGEPRPAVFFMGDLNDAFHPRRVLREQGFVDCFSALGLPATPTHPQRPCSDPDEDALPDQALDWIFALEHEHEAASPRCVLANVLLPERSHACSRSL